MPKHRSHVCLAEGTSKKLFRVTVIGRETRTRAKVCRQGTSCVGTIFCEAGAKTKAPLRSGEAELYAVCTAAQQALGMQSMAKRARNPAGLGKVRHLGLRCVSIQVVLWRKPVALKEISAGKQQVLDKDSDHETYGKFGMTVGRTEV